MEWWKRGNMHQIYLRSFQDSNGDRIDDLRSIISRIVYLESLDIDIVWLGPVH